MTECEQDDLEGYTRIPGSNLFRVDKSLLRSGVSYRVVEGSPRRHNKFGKAPAAHLFKAGFDSGLGCHVGSRADVKDRIREINEKTGSNLIEIGNETVAPKQIRRKVDKQGMSEYMQHLENQH